MCQDPRSDRPARYSAQQPPKGDTNKLERQSGEQRQKKDNGEYNNIKRTDRQQQKLPQDSEKKRQRHKTYLGSRRVGRCQSIRDIIHSIQRPRQHNRIGSAAVTHDILRLSILLSGRRGGFGAVGREVEWTCVHAAVRERRNDMSEGIAKSEKKKATTPYSDNSKQETKKQNG